jgi:phage shock protein PspC (stress-responsive transcriptional regulator)
MTDSNELSRLAELHQRGALSDEEFSRAKARVLNGSAGTGHPVVLALNTLRRSRDERWIGGVCGGIARITGLATWAWRLIFALLFLCAGSGVLIYLLMWALVPLEEMRLGHSPRPAA